MAKHVKHLSGVAFALALLQLILLAIYMPRPGLAAPTSAVAAENAERTLPDVHSLPLTRGSAVPVGVPGRNDKQGTLIADSSGGFLLVFNSGLGVNIDDLQLYAAASVDGKQIGDAQRLALVDQPFVAQPAFVTVAKRPWLYFASSDSLFGQPTLWRAEFTEKGFSPPEQLPSVPGHTRMTGWPQWSSTAEGNVVLSFRDGKSKPRWAVQAPGDTPTSSIIGEVRAAYVRVVEMTGGGWFLSYQYRAKDKGMLTYVRISTDQVTWTPEQPISEPKWPEVHDAFALPRRDQGVDLYYSYPSLLDGKPCFGLYRRAVLAADRFGPEQQVTLPGEFCAYSASAHRLRDGGVLLTFSNILASGGGGVTEARLHVAQLSSDAPSTE